MMYRVMVMFDPAQCVATPLDSVTQQPLPSYERSWLPVTEGEPGAGDGGLTSAQGAHYTANRAPPNLNNTEQY